MPATRVWDIRRAGGQPHSPSAATAQDASYNYPAHGSPRTQSGSAAVMDQIAALSDRLIVMSELSSQLLQEIFKVPGTNINIVPHGVPDLPFLDPNFYKD